MNDKSEKDFITRVTIESIETLPILSQIEFVKNVIFSCGGDKESIPQNSMLILSNDVLGNIIALLKNNSKAASLKVGS